MKAITDAWTVSGKAGYQSGLVNKNTFFLYKEKFVQSHMDL